MIPRKNTHNHLPSAFREKLPFGIHEQQLIRGKNLLDSIPRAKENFDKIHNELLKTIVLSKLPREYNKTKHHEVKPEEKEKRERYHKLAARDVTKMVVRGRVVELALGYMKTDISQHANLQLHAFVEAMLRKNILKLAEAREIGRKIAELENLSRYRANRVKPQVLNFILKEPYNNVLKFIDNQIEFARQERGR